MNRNEYMSRTISLVAIIIAIVGLSIGFAAISNTLNINSNAEVNPNEGDFEIKFSDDNGKIDSQIEVVPVVSSSEVSADVAVIDNTGPNPMIKGLKAYFTRPGQSATYSFYANNTGLYMAYLKSILYTDVDGNATKKCTPLENTTPGLVAEACKSIDVLVTINGVTYDGTYTGINNHKLPSKNNEPIIVKIVYKDGGILADGKFIVSFGDIILTYSSN